MKQRSLLRTLFLVLATTLALALTATTAQAQERGNDEARPSPNATVSQTIGTTPVTITYGRPHVNGRDIFGGLVPYEEVWRTGANEATTITFPANVKIEGEALPAGTYALFTIPGEEEWALIFNKQANQWGHFSHDASQDALRVNVDQEEGAPMAEMFTITFEDVTSTSATAVLHWDTVRVPIPIELD